MANFTRINLGQMKGSYFSRSMDLPKGSDLVRPYRKLMTSVL